MCHLAHAGSQILTCFDTRQVMSILFWWQDTTYLGTRQLTGIGISETLMILYHGYGMEY